MSGQAPPVSDILTWLYTDFQKQDYVALAIGLAANYYWIGGLPNQGQDIMMLVQGYLAGGVASYAYNYATNKSQ